MFGFAISDQRCTTGDRNWNFSRQLFGRGDWRPRLCWGPALNPYRSPRGAERWTL